MAVKYLMAVAAGALPVVAAATLLCGLLYVALQQSVRLSANDPQVQLAEDAAAALSSGASPSAVMPAAIVDMARSLALYLIVFGDDGHPLAASVQLDGAIPTVPAGVFAVVREHGENRVTWEPRAGVRSAAVVVRYQGAASGYVLAGRSLREIEKREDLLLAQVTAGWLVLVAVTVVATAVVVHQRRPSSQRDA